MTTNQPTITDYEQRQWTHEESPRGVPSASAYRLGCRCGNCTEMYRNYMKEYRRNKVPIQQNPDETAFYHTHKGQPSSNTARRWGCSHPRCLSLADLHLNEDGVVVDDATGTVDPWFGAANPQPQETPAAVQESTQEAGAA